VAIKRKRLLSSLFIWNLLMILIPLLVAIIVINAIFKNFIIEEITRNDQLVLYHTQQNISSFLHEATDTLELVHIASESRSGEVLNQEINKINSVNDFYQSIEVLDSYGAVINTLTSNAYTSGYHRSGEDFYKKLVNGKTMYWSTPFISSITGEPTVILSLKTGDNIIVGYLNLADLREDVQRSANMDATLSVSVLDQNGIIIANNNVALVRQRQLDPNIDLIKQGNLSDYPTRFLQSEDNLALYVKNENPDWIIVMYDNFSDELSVANSLLYGFSTLLILAVFIFATLTLLRSAVIKRSIADFIHKTELIATGKYNIQFSEQRFEEFYLLSENFKVMANNLELREKELEQIAFTDSLTHIKNRAYLQNIDHNNMEENGCLYGMLYLDIDNFKNINDSHGHSVGDALLVAVSERLLHCVNEDTIVSRIGGDEFVLFVSDSEEMKTIYQTIEKVLNAFLQPFLIEHMNLIITASIGISISKAESYDYELLLRTADIAMYQAKQSGKNNFKFYDPEMEVKIKRRHLIEQNLRTAVANCEFSVVYQPQMCKNAETIRGFEALVRWKNSNLGEVSPAEFIPIAEETGIILEIGNWVLKKALKTIANINQRFKSDYILSINVSPVEMRAPFFHARLEEAIQNSGVKNELVELEITENVFLSNLEEVTKLLSALHSNNIQISLDDFGTGFSSLSYLNKLPISTLKIDRMFIHNLENDDKNQKMVESIILLAHKLGLLVVAEGVEGEEQLKLLKQYQCDCIQGFYFSKPLELNALLDFINCFQYKKA